MTSAPVGLWLRRTCEVCDGRIWWRGSGTKPWVCSPECSARLAADSRPGRRALAQGRAYAEGHPGVARLFAEARERRLAHPELATSVASSAWAAPHFADYETTKPLDDGWAESTARPRGRDEAVKWLRDSGHEGELEDFPPDVRTQG